MDYLTDGQMNIQSDLKSSFATINIGDYPKRPQFLLNAFYAYFSLGKVIVNSTP